MKQTLKTSPPPGPCDNSMKTLSTLEHQIKRGYRYDRSKTDLKAFSVLYHPTLSGPIFFTNPLIDRIKKKDVNNSKIFFETNIFFEAADANTAGKNIFYGFYEWDWWASKKDLLNPDTSPKAPNEVTLRMKYSDEWYAYEAGAIDDLLTNVE